MDHKPAVSRGPTVLSAYAINAVERLVYCGNIRRKGAVVPNTGTRAPGARDIPAARGRPRSIGDANRPTVIGQSIAGYIEQKERIQLITAWRYIRPAAGAGPATARARRARDEALGCARAIHTHEVLGRNICIVCLACPDPAGQTIDQFIAAAATGCISNSPAVIGSWTINTVQCCIGGITGIHRVPGAVVLQYPWPLIRTKSALDSHRVAFIGADAEYTRQISI